MMRLILPTCLALLGLPAMADIDAVIDDHIIARHGTFAQYTTGLAQTAMQDCTPANVIPAYHAAFDAWVAVSHIRFGPIEDNGEGLAVAFWPDKKGKIPKALSLLIATQDPVVTDPAVFAKHTVAARGFFALEQMLFDAEFAGYDRGSYSCALTQAISTDLARIATQTANNWVDYAVILRSAGQPENSIFLTDKEGAQALYTNLLAGLDYISDQRIARPLGGFDKPRPKRAEARRSLRSLRNIIVSLEALHEMAALLADGEAVETMAAFVATIKYAKDLDAHVFENLAQTSAKFQLGSLQELMAVTHEAAAAEIGIHLNVVAGFNALDGD